MDIALPYRDQKRPLWLLSLFVPTLGLIGPALYLLVSPSELWLWLSPLFFYFGIPLLDALKVLTLPIAEVHLTNIHRRETLYQHSLVSLAATGVICGFGPFGYELAIRAVAQRVTR